MLAEIVGHFFVADQVAPPHVGGIELQTMADDVEQALADEVRFVASGAPIGADGCFVGENAKNIAAIIFHSKRTAQHGGGGDGGNAAMGAGVAPHVE